MTVEHYEELKRLPNPEGRFGRNVAHDIRSRAYRPRTIENPLDVDWEVELPILDQQEGSCVLQTIVSLIAFSEHWRTLTSEQKRLILTDTQEFIRNWYRWTSRRDPFTGAWEPDDTGTDGNSGSKCAVFHGFAKGYVHGFGIEEGFTLLNHGPIGIGGVWMSSFDRPDAEGIIRWSPDAYERGGHEWAAIGNDTRRGLIKARQTWGLGYGRSGIFHVPYEVLERILDESGDIIQLVPLDQLEPEPDWDEVMIRKVKPWAFQSSWGRIIRPGRASVAAEGFREWMERKGKT